MSEQWKIIEGYPDYAISSEGRVASRKKQGIWILRKIGLYERYPQVTLVKNGKVHCVKVHRLVARAFIPNPKNLATVNHKDGDKSNNRVENLEWLSQKDNIRHGIKTGLIRELSGKNHPSYQNNEYIFQHEKHGTVHCTRYELRQEYGLTKSGIADLIKGRSKSCKGWKLLKVA